MLGYYILNSVALYARLGFIKGNFKYAEYKDDAQSSNIGLTDYFWLSGVSYGIGVLINLQPNWQVRFDYNRIDYRTYTNTTFPMPDNIERTIKITPHSNLFQASLVYQFL